MLDFAGGDHQKIGKYPAGPYPQLILTTYEQIVQLRFVMGSCPVFVDFDIQLEVGHIIGRADHGRCQLLLAINPAFDALGTHLGHSVGRGAHRDMLEKPRSSIVRDFGVGATGPTHLAGQLRIVGLILTRAAKQRTQRHSSQPS